MPQVLNTNIIDEIITVTNGQAFETARNMASMEGILCGISSGAAVWVALTAAGKPGNEGKTIVAILPSTGGAVSEYAAVFMRKSYFRNRACQKTRPPFIKADKRVVISRSGS